MAPKKKTAPVTAAKKKAATAAAKKTVDAPVSAAAVEVS